MKKFRSYNSWRSKHQVGRTPFIYYELDVVREGSPVEEDDVDQQNSMKLKLATQRIQGKLAILDTARSNFVQSQR
jgi:hypothetical protein